VWAYGLRACGAARPAGARHAEQVRAPARRRYAPRGPGLWRSRDGSEARPRSPGRSGDIGWI